MAGHRVTYTLPTKPVNELAETADKKPPTKTNARYGRADLLRIDEPGCMELDRHGAELLCQVLTEHKEKNSVAIASNESFSGWTKTFTDPASGLPGRAHGPRLHPGGHPDPSPGRPHDTAPSRHHPPPTTDHRCRAIPGTHPHTHAPPGAVTAPPPHGPPPARLPACTEPGLHTASPATHPLPPTRPPNHQAVWSRVVSPRTGLMPPEHRIETSGRAAQPARRPRPRPRPQPPSHTPKPPRPPSTAPGHTAGPSRRPPAGPQTAWQGHGRPGTGRGAVSAGFRPDRTESQEHALAMAGPGHRVRAAHRPPRRLDTSSAPRSWRRSAAMSGTATVPLHSPGPSCPSFHSALPVVNTRDRPKQYMPQTKPRSVGRIARRRV